MFAATTSVALVGVEPQPVRVEVHLGAGGSAFTLVGLPDTAVREAKERVLAALASSGYRRSNRRTTVNLAPADLPKVGSAYDLPIALSLLAAATEIPPGASHVVALGELALDGSLRPARGGLAAGLVAASLGKTCLLPPESAAEADLATGADVRAVTSLAEAVAVALGEGQGTAIPSGPPPPTDPVADLGDVRGQALARRALEIAAAGGHHLLLNGTPGSGKTMLARCLPGLLPPLDDREALAVAQVWAAAGQRHTSRLPPMRSPHHSATMAGLIGGGSGVPTPGEASLAHLGVLFLDELGEFPGRHLDALRQPLEGGTVTIARQAATVEFPARFQLVAATNPCPCGFTADAEQVCRCTPSRVERYRRRLSGPLLDRIDLHVPVQRVTADELAGPGGEPSETVARRVETARRRQRDRGVLNARLERGALDELDYESAALDLLHRSVSAMAITGRGWDRVRRVARTIADLAGDDAIAEGHVAEALALRKPW